MEDTSELPDNIQINFLKIFKIKNIITNELDNIDSLISENIHDSSINKINNTILNLDNNINNISKYLHNIYVFVKKNKRQNQVKIEQFTEHLCDSDIFGCKPDIVDTPPMNVSLGTLGINLPDLSAMANTVCPPGQQLSGELCYDSCPNGYTNVAGVCWPGCSGLHDYGAGCDQPSYGNGVGYIPIYNDCKDGSYDVAGTCWKHNYKLSWGAVNCNGPKNNETFWDHQTPNCNTYWDGCCSHAPWWLGGGCIGCPRTNCTMINHHDHIGWNDCYSTDFPYVYTNISDRGTHCNGDDQNIAGLCYKKCSSGYHYHGSNICVKDCPPGTTDTGATCTKNTTTVAVRGPNQQIEYAIAKPVIDAANISLSAVLNTVGKVINFFIALRNKFKHLGADIRNTAADIIGKIIQFGKNVSDKVKSIINKIEQLGKDIGDKLINVFTSTFGIFKKVGDSLLNMGKIIATIIVDLPAFIQQSWDITVTNYNFILDFSQKLYTLWKGVFILTLGLIITIYVYLNIMFGIIPDGLTISVVSLIISLITMYTAPKTIETIQEKSLNINPILLIMCIIITKLLIIDIILPYIIDTINSVDSD